MRRAARRDAGEPAIIEALERVGATVVQLNVTDVADLLVGWQAVNFLLEVKDPIGVRGGASRDGQQLSEGQLKWHRTWKGQATVVRSPLEALEAIGAA